jgi:ATP-dependent protease ClpP protease subunit
MAERSRWVGQIVGLIDSASENDVIDITIDACGCNSVYSNRSILSAIERCKGTVITHAGFLTSVADVALWLAGDVLKWSKHMTAIMIRQQVYGFGGDVRDFVSKAEDAKTNFAEFSAYISARGLFTSAELKNMYETRGMLSLSGQELDARMAKLKQVA